MDLSTGGQIHTALRALRILRVNTVYCVPGAMWLDVELCALPYQAILDKVPVKNRTHPNQSNTNCSHSTCAGKSGNTAKGQTIFSFKSLHYCHSCSEPLKSFWKRLGTVCAQTAEMFLMKHVHHSHGKQFLCTCDSNPTWSSVHVNYIYHNGDHIEKTKTHNLKLLHVNIRRYHWTLWKTFTVWPHHSERHGRYWWASAAGWMWRRKCYVSDWIAVKGLNVFSYQILTFQWNTVKFDECIGVAVCGLQVNLKFLSWQIDWPSL